MDIAPGQRHGRFRFERRLGRGAFAEVFRARDVLAGRTVALKILRLPRGGGARAAGRRMLREARLAGRLSSPHVVALYGLHDLGDGTWMQELEYVDGGTLEDLLEERGRLPPPETRRVLGGILRGLDAAHRAGVIHRDVKPGNVLLGRDGAVKLTDFGLGRRVRHARVRTSSDGLVMGTPLYMAPEVVVGERATVASDLWSAGIVLYRMLSGRLPFREESLIDLLRAIRRREPEPLPADADPRLVRIAARFLAKDPAKRYGSCREALETLESGSGARDLHAVPSPPGIRRQAGP